ncbi:unnamed protein product, partial [Linum tenue]
SSNPKPRNPSLPEFRFPVPFCHSRKNPKPRNPSLPEFGIPLPVCHSRLLFRSPIKQVALKIQSAEMEPEQFENGNAAAPAPGNPNNPPEPLDDVPQLPLGASRSLKSDVWPHFTRVMVSGILKAKCNYCKKVLAAKSTNVSASELKALEGVFSAMAMDDTTVEDNTVGDGVQSELNGEEDDAAAVINLLD